MGENFNAMVRLVNLSRIKSNGNHHFEWDKEDRSRLVLLILRSNKTLRGSRLLQFLIECKMINHDMLSLIVTSNILKLKEILSYMAETDFRNKTEKFNLFLKLVEDESSALIDDDNLKQVWLLLSISEVYILVYQVIEFCMRYKTEKIFIDKAIITIMQHSSLDIKQSMRKKSQLMGKIFCKLYKLIQDEKEYRIKKILKSLKETILSLGKEHALFQEQCKEINQFNAAYEKIFKINYKGEIIESDTDDKGNLKDFIMETSDSNDDDNSGSSNDSRSNRSDDDDNSGSQASSTSYHRADSDSSNDSCSNRSDDDDKSGSGNDSRSNRSDDDDKSGSGNYSRSNRSDDDDKSGSGVDDVSSDNDSFLRKRKRTS